MPAPTSPCTSDQTRTRSPTAEEGSRTNASSRAPRRKDDVGSSRAGTPAAGVDPRRVGHRLRVTDPDRTLRAIGARENPPGRNTAGSPDMTEVAVLYEVAPAGSAIIEQRVEVAPGGDEPADLQVEPLPDGFEPPPFGVARLPTRVVSLECVDDLVECESSDVLESAHDGEPVSDLGGMVGSWTRCGSPAGERHDVRSSGSRRSRRPSASTVP